MEIDKGMNELYNKLILEHSLIFICNITLFQMNWVENKCSFMYWKAQGYVCKKFCFETHLRYRFFRRIVIILLKVIDDTYGKTFYSSKKYLWQHLLTIKTLMIHLLFYTLLYIGCLVGVYSKALSLSFRSLLLWHGLATKVK